MGLVKRNVEKPEEELPGGRWRGTAAMEAPRRERVYPLPISLQFQRQWVETVDFMDRRRREEEKKHGAVLGKTPSSRSADNSVGAAARDETTFQS